MNILSELLGSFISSIFYIIISKIFDSSLSPEVSNFISLLITLLIDIFFQTLIYKKLHLFKRKGFLPKAIFFEFIGVIINQIIFQLIYNYLKKNNKIINILNIRMNASLITYILYTFFIRKHIVIGPLKNIKDI